jgi:hypothetical protein
MVLTTKGFRVVDCGKDCPIADMVAAAAREQAFAVLVSGLISPVLPLVRQLRGLLRERGLRRRGRGRRSRAQAMHGRGAERRLCGPRRLRLRRISWKG